MNKSGSEVNHSEKKRACVHHEHECFYSGTNKSVFYIILGVLSLVWFAIRTGTKPSRFLYPCQQTALANSVAFVPGLYPLLLLSGKTAARLNKTWTLGILVLLLIFTLAAAVGREYTRQTSWAEMVPNQPLGTPAGVSPGRVVWAYDENATTGNFSQYWTQLDQTKVDNMMNMSLIALSGEKTPGAAIAKLFPCGNNCTGKKIAIKVNFNNSGRSDAAMDANSQTVKSLLKYLTTAEPGVFQPFNQQDISIYDASRKIRDYFASQVTGSYPNVKLFSESGIVLSGDNYVFDSKYCQPSGTHKVPVVVKEADYLIDMPLLKAHTNAGVTLAFKNYFGSATDPVGFHPCIDRDMKFLVGLYTSGFRNADNTPTTLAQKTKLIIGDALYGNFHGQNNPPDKWSFFKNDSPNSLFVSQDPVAVDTVMFDLIMQELGKFNDAKQQYLEEAAQRPGGSLGVHEHPGVAPGCADLKNLHCWKYTKLDFVKCDISGNKLDPLCTGTPVNPSVSPQPTNVVPTFVCAGGANCPPSITPTVPVSGYISPTLGVAVSPTLIAGTTVSPTVSNLPSGVVSVTLGPTHANGNNGGNPTVAPTNASQQPKPGQQNPGQLDKGGLLAILLSLIQVILELFKSLFKF